MIFRFLTCTLFLSCVILSYAQPDLQPIVGFEDIVAELVTRNDDVASAEEFTEILTDLAANPVKINEADDDELARLFWLSSIQRSAIRQYIGKQGLLKSKFELAYVPSISAHEASILAHFIILENG